MKGYREPWGTHWEQQKHHGELKKHHWGQMNLTKSLSPPSPPPQRKKDEPS